MKRILVVLALAAAVPASISAEPPPGEFLDLQGIALSVCDPIIQMLPSAKNAVDMAIEHLEVAACAMGFQYGYERGQIHKLPTKKNGGPK